MKVYLCGPINGKDDDEAVTWRDFVKQELGAENCTDPMRRDYRGRESHAGVSEEIVGGDLIDIIGADVVLVNASLGGSWGTAMEVFFAHSRGKHVIAWGAGDNPSPWLREHCDWLAPELHHAVAYLKVSVEQRARERRNREALRS